MYVVGTVHANAIEGFWSLIKRGVMGSYRKVSKKYCRSMWPSSNSGITNRLNADIFGEAIRGC